MSSAHKRKVSAVALTDAAIGALSKPPGLHAAPSLILWHLVKELPVGGAHLNVSALAAEVGLPGVHCAKSMKVLLQQGMIIRGAKDGLLHHYSLNPAYFYTL